MKKIMFIVSLLSSIAFNSKAQCPIKAIADKSIIFCGDSVNLAASVELNNKLFKDDFNNGSISANWLSYKDCNVENGSGTYSCAGPSPEGSHYLWFNTGTYTPRYIVSKPLNLSGLAGVNLAFYMKYGIQGNTPCEGIDLPNEGVHLEYSVDGGTTWIQIEYWDPLGGYDYNRTNWQHFSYILPATALTASTQIRWIQKQSSGIGYDSWGLDNIEVSTNVPGYTFDWLHDGLPANASPFTPKVTPVMGKSTYTVYYSNIASGGTDSCHSTVSVTVNAPSINASASQTVINAGQSAQLFVTDNSLPLVNLGYCTAVNDSGCISSSEFGVGKGMTVNSFNSITGNVFGDFGGAFVTSQILYRAKELKAAGMTAGEINSISFNIAHTTDAGGTFTSLSSYKNFQIKMTCVTDSNVTAFKYNLSDVFSPRTISIQGAKWNELNFDKKYYWDGVSNILIQVCWFEENGAPSSSASYARTVDEKTPYKSYIQSTTNFSNGVCDYTSFVDIFSQRPNIKFSMCKQRQPLGAYHWSAIGGSFSSFIQNPVVSPTVTTTYIVTASNEESACTSSDTITIVVDNVTSIYQQPVNSINNLIIKNLSAINGAVSYNLSSIYNCDAIVELTDISGRTLKQEKIKLNSGDNKLSSDIGEINTGLYFINIITQQHGKTSSKFIYTAN